MLIGEAVPVTAELAGEHPLAEPLAVRGGRLVEDGRVVQQAPPWPAAARARPCPR
jgi:hypothetical protein